MKLDPLLVPFVSSRSFAPSASVEEERANELTLHRSAIGHVITPRPESVSVRDVVIGGPDPQKPVTVRIYTPSGGTKQRAGLVFAHGGGWVTGCIETADPHCGNMAASADVVVVSVEYRLAPEDPFPAGVEDYYYAVQWVFGHSEELGIDSSRIAVGGGSAGGNLAAVACLMAKDRKGPKIALQLLEAPALDLTLSGQSFLDCEKHFPSIAALGRTLAPRYLINGEPREHPYVSPLLASDLSGLPPAVLLAAEVDPIRDDCERYANRLVEAGGMASWRVFPGLLHGTDSLTAVLPMAREWQAECVRVLASL